MKCLFSRYRGFLPLITLLIGIGLGGFLPHMPLHAVATDRAETYLIATGLLDSEVEAVYFLDCLTGDLLAAVPGKVTGGFTGLYRYNVLKDLQVDLAKNPHFLMVTGLADFRTGTSRGYGGASVVYVAETTTGKAVAYAIPWDRSRWNSRTPVQDVLHPVGAINFRNTQTILPATKP
ncbi:MAG: hypothetical protein ABSA26_06355 [Thermoguttaceae bacterium]|jgi:hypothetical protein